MRKQQKSKIIQKKKERRTNSTATVQPRCGDERDSFQLGVEAVCRPGTPEQW